MKRVPLCNQCLHVMLCQIKLMELSFKKGFSGSEMSTLYSETSMYETSGGEGY